MVLLLFEAVPRYIDHQLRTTRLLWHSNYHEEKRKPGKLSLRQVDSIKIEQAVSFQGFLKLPIHLKPGVNDPLLSSGTADTPEIDFPHQPCLRYQPHVI